LAPSTWAAPATTVRVWKVWPAVSSWIVWAWTAIRSRVKEGQAAVIVGLA
jgi:hypothetical protein